MSADEQIPAGASASSKIDDAVMDAIIDQERSARILQAKELYSRGSRDFLVKCYAEAADELSQVCSLYEELYGELSDELGMPYLLYAKSLIALALDENKVVDVPDEGEDNDDDDDEDEAEAAESENGDAAATSSTTTNGTKIQQKSDEADSTQNEAADEKKLPSPSKEQPEISLEEAQVSSTDECPKPTNGATVTTGDIDAAVNAVLDGEKPSTSNGDASTAVVGEEQQEEEDNDVNATLELAWELLELAAKIFSRHGLSGLPNLAEVHTELGNIELENNILSGAREDYEKALRIYADLPPNYRRAMAEIHYKIGLSFLMEQRNKESANSLKEACSLIEREIQEINEKEQLSEKDKSNIQDLEETKEEICAKIAEIEDQEAQQIAEVRAALDSYIKPMGQFDDDAPRPSSSSAAASSSSAISSSTSKANDISHLIKRKKPEDVNTSTEASPAKRPAP